MTREPGADAGAPAAPARRGMAPDLLRGLTSPRVSRRRVLQFGGLSALGAGLTACGIPGSKASGGGLGGQAWRDEIARFWSQQKKAGHLDFVNWPLYIDVGKGQRPPVAGPVHQADRDHGQLQGGHPGRRRPTTARSRRC